ncbi:MAG: DnaJ domain-containing protein [Chthoniobacteraceae bacterium]
MNENPPDHYATLGLDRRCSSAQIRTAYRDLARRHHPDLNGGSRDSIGRTQTLNAAYETLNDPEKRRDYDRESAAAARRSEPARAGRIERDIAQDVFLRHEDFLRGICLQIKVSDPAHSHGLETYELVIPPETAPGARFRVPRLDPFAGGWVKVRVRARSDHRFKMRGTDLRCDLRIRSRRAAAAAFCSSALSTDRKFASRGLPANRRGLLDQRYMGDKQ